MSKSSNGIKIVALSGSVRPGNFTAKALALVEDEFRQQFRVSYEWFDPATLDLPLPGTGAPTESAKRMQEAVGAATGIVLATPEYHGSFSSLMKLQIENLGFPSVLAGKPVALLGVAAGVIGAVKSLEQLRGVCSHVGAIVLPGPVSVAGVQKVFDEEGKCLDSHVEKRVRGVAASLWNYIHENICPRFTLESMVREGEEVT